MKKVFLGGSRKVSRLNKNIKERLQNIITQKFYILIGDANGADKAMQKYLKEMNYNNVFVFCSGNICRNNIGNWDTKKIKVNSNSRGIKYFMIKDAEMAKQADYGFMLWDGKSAGTINNILNLLKYQKKILLYFAPENKFYTVSTIENLNEILKKCNSNDLEKINKKINYKKQIEEFESLFSCVSD